MNSFYIELSSNAKYLLNDLSSIGNVLSPFNTIGNFKNKIELLHPLEGNWEVGIAEISYTKSWRNLRNTCVLGIEKLFTKVTPDIAKAFMPGYFPFNDNDRHGIVRAGHYDSIQVLCNEINKELTVYKDLETFPEFIYDSISRKVYLKPGIKDKKFVIPTLDKELFELLGFDYYSIENPMYNHQDLILSQRAADITGGIHTLFIYCNLVVPQYIGDTRAKLLKTVEIPNNSNFGDQILINYERPHYVPIIVNDFEEIEIDIKDDSNQAIRFMYGRTRIKLHFRKCHI